ncbi:hypothetical protein [Natronococcus sp. A-GB7]|uniref:hypothetical protein n=1 Tax=Natronococcus sp. A-GB7 TaxID=3037649 RepID=UPI00241CC6B0|nr:hypothetical protein [Natronococcus sp. A-GB7]MDG5821268.1 hypothetical protein [Natronococcus sp. A-GB7]
MRTTTRFGVIGLVAVLAIGLLSAGAVAGGNSATDDVTQVGSIDASLEDEHVELDGLELSSDGLPSYEIDERAYDLESAGIQSDGVTVDVNDRTYEICSVDISLENVSITVSDISINGDE